MEKIGCILLSIWFSTITFSQVNDSIFRSATNILYIGNTDINSPLFNGIEHVGYPTYYIGSAYRSENWQKGSIVYEGVFYKDVYIMYDMVKEAVIVRHPNGFTKVILFSPRVEYVVTPEYKFVYISNSKGLMKEGFYEEFQSGKIVLLAKKINIIEESVTSSEIVHKFILKTSFYSFKDGTYYSIKNANSLLSLTGQKNEIQQYLKKIKVRYKDNPELTLIKISEYYNSTH